MYKLLLSVFLVFASLNGYAEIFDKSAIPVNITDQIYKKHPKAADLSGAKKIHYGQDLLRINYKEGEDKFVDYYRPDGHFFVAGLLIAADDLMFADSKAKLKGEFNDYHIKEAVLIVNPNGAGEEFDVVLESAGRPWNVIINKKGDLEKSEVE